METSPQSETVFSALVAELETLELEEEDEFLAGWEDQPQLRPTDTIWQRADQERVRATACSLLTSCRVRKCSSNP